MVSAYSRWALIRGWALNRINTVVVVFLRLGGRTNSMNVLHSGTSSTFEKHKIHTFLHSSACSFEMLFLLFFSLLKERVITVSIYSSVVFSETEDTALAVAYLHFLSFDQKNIFAGSQVKNYI